MTVQLIRLTAKEMAAAFWDASRSDTFCETYPSVVGYVAQCWRLFEKDARDTLTSMLGMPHVSEHQKREIYEALQEDHGRRSLMNDADDRKPLIVRTH